MDRPQTIWVEFTCPTCEKVYKLVFNRVEAEKILAEQEAEDSNFRQCDDCPEEDKDDA